MREKLEQSKEFIEEVERLQGTSGTWIFAGLRTAKNNVSEYPTLYKWLFTGTSDEDNANQLTFAKIWAGEIELVEKKDKYVIYQVNENSKTGKVHYTIYAMDEESRFYPRRVNEDRVPDRNASPYELFDQDFAFAMRDTSKFNIEKVEEND
ncbi:hypothetical protein KAR50_00090 [Periweissella fabaria]|uniref:DUF1642 domain-containing protein n=1 Tax=Periweissella fabaria TaxID=546157 RepID=A0ABN8BNG2_9LACO|nr:hypothetical protein [Periweissella fabaria]MCM0596261.1 hypothetical protein [Periweissella fabaria]CAH0417487.1 hypothetical protein WFA24289_01829 [Periweissella fabaria]